MFVLLVFVFLFIFSCLTFGCRDKCEIQYKIIGNTGNAVNKRGGILYLSLEKFNSKNKECWNGLDEVLFRESEFCFPPVTIYVLDGVDKVEVSDKKTDLILERFGDKVICKYVYSAARVSKMTVDPFKTGKYLDQ